MIRRARRWLGLVLVLAPACAREESATRAPIAARAPERVVCANTAAAEFVARLVGPERVVGLPEQADDYSSLDLRAGAWARVPRFARYQAESVLALAPDLVVTHAWQSADTTAVLKGEGIEVLVLRSATSYADIRDTLVLLGRRLEAEAEAARALAGLDERVQRLGAHAAARAALRVLTYSNDGTGGSTAGSETTADTVVRLAGARNAAAEAGIRGHRSLEFERLIQIDPDVIVVSARARGEGGSATRDVIESTPALARLKARAAGRIVEISAALVSADSPPLVDAAEVLARELDRILAGGR